MRRTLPAAASSATAPLLDAPAQAGRIVGVSSSGAWIAVPRSGPPHGYLAHGYRAHRSRAHGCLVLTSDDRVRLPNALLLPRLPQAVAHLAAGDAVWVGDGRVDLGALAIQPQRWWNSRPSLPCTRPRTLAAQLGRIDGPPEIPLAAAAAFRRALAAPDATATATGARAVAPALDLLGRGPGLTPLGDDVLTGALAALRLIGPALGGRGAARARALLSAISDAVLPRAHDRTTMLSAALLHHSAAGEVAAPLGAFLRALTGRGDPREALRDLLGVGHTSGAGLATGAIAAAGALAARELAS